jgi:uncharacterized membrane-anchored protein YhcB (DUF1043 family)
MPDQKQQIDSFLGNGWYDEWRQMDKQVVDEGNRFDAYRTRLKLSFASPLIDQIYEDQRLLNTIAKDYRQGMTLVLNGRPPVKEKLKKLHDLYTLALGAAENDNDVLEALFVTGFAAAWVVFPFALLEARSQTMLAALEELKKELEEAERELTNAHRKRAFHLAVAFFEAMFPEISLTARVGIFLSDVAMDKALGPKRPTTAQKYTGIVTPGVKQFSEAVHHIEEYGETARSVAEKTGKVATVATFYFDFKEIGEGEERVEKLTELTKEVKEAYDKLIKVLDENRPKLNLFLANFQKWMQAIESISMTAANIRRALSDDIARYGYNRGSAAMWMAVP